jgi:hypothetical protein
MAGVSAASRLREGRALCRAGTAMRQEQGAGQGWGRMLAAWALEMASTMVRSWNHIARRLREMSVLRQACGSNATKRLVVGAKGF